MKLFKQLLASTVTLLGVVYLLCGTAQQAGAQTTTGTVSYSTTVDVGSSATLIELEKFNETLGELTSVTITIGSSTLQGYVEVTNNYSTDSTISSITASLSIVAGTATGFDDAGSLTKTVTTTPSSSNASISSGETQTYTVASGQKFSLVNNSQSIASSDWSAYESSDGSGVVTLLGTEIYSVTLTGGKYSMDSTNASAATTVTVTYTYSVVPEPATWALMFGGLGALIIMQKMRRKVS